jgi:hypothetical protein
MGINVGEFVYHMSTNLGVKEPDSSGGFVKKGSEFGRKAEEMIFV